MYKQFGIKEEILNLADKIKAELESIFNGIEKISEYNILINLL